MKFFRDPNGFVSFHTIECWCKSAREIGSIDLSKSAGRPRMIRTNVAVRKVKIRWEKRKRVASRKIACQLAGSGSSVQRILRHDLRLKSFPVLREPLPIDEHKGNKNEIRQLDTNKFS